MQYGWIPAGAGKGETRLCGDSRSPENSEEISPGYAGKGETGILAGDPTLLYNRTFMRVN